MIKKNIYLIRSPLQALNAIEAQQRFTQNEENIIIVLYRREIDKDLILKTLSHSKWSSIIVKNLKPHYQIFQFFQSCLDKYPHINYCFIGDYSTVINYFMHRLNYQKLIILEDGTDTIRIVKLIEDKSLHRTNKTAYNQKNIFQIFINKLLRIDSSYYYNAYLFSIYNLNTNIKIIHNDYKFLKKELHHLEKKEIAFFIGSNLIENILVSEKVFEEYIKRIVKHYQKKNLKFIYILHRKEDIKYMNLLGEKFEFECIKFDNIIEIEFLNLTYTPIEISTFLSTAITTLQNIYSDENYHFFHLYPKHINLKFKQPINDLEKYFIQEGIIMQQLPNFSL